jgi:SnoaL-like domain
MNESNEMNGTNGERVNEGLRVALAYHRAWTSGDFERAMTYISPDIHCQAPAGPVVGAEAFRGFMEPFARSLKNSRMLAAFGEGDAALLMYDTETVPVAEAPGAEWHIVSEGRIVRMRIIFDRLPFDLARRAASS